jgi:acyl carrier protein
MRFTPAMDSTNPDRDNTAHSARAELLVHLPEQIQASYQRYLETGDMEAADEVVLAIIKDHVPSKKVAQIPAKLTDDSTLTGDLGIDSVSIADALYVLEDVFDVSIANRDLANLRTLGDLKKFLRSKLANGPTG